MVMDTIHGPNHFLAINLMFSQCDEKHPSCLQCNTVDLQCAYAATRTSASASSENSSLPEKSKYVSPKSSLDNHTTVSNRPIQFLDTSVTSHSEENFTVNMLHMQLMDHFSNETAKTIVFDDRDQKRSQDLVMKAALLAPYLMQEILALSALHLGTLLPAHKGFYHHQASGLQTRALSLFNSCHLEVDAENCVPVVIFSSLLAMHTLCDVVGFHDGDFSNFLNGFIRCLDLHRGIRAVTSHSWALLKNSDLQPILEVGAILHDANDLVGKECHDLRALLNTADIGPTPMKACQTAIDHLQNLFDMEENSHANTNTSIIWPALVPPEYIDLLMKRTPEALVVLAHYGVLLHRHRRHWFIGGAGRLLISSISNHLGSYWDTWIAWPNIAVADT